MSSIIQNQKICTSDHFKEPQRYIYFTYYVIVQWKYMYCTLCQG